MEKEFEFVVIGGGSAGMAVAARLSAAGRNTLLIEAGRQNGNLFDAWMTEMPAGYPYCFTSSNFNWLYEGEPEPHANNRKLFQPRGKILGGSSGINGMVWLRPHPKLFDEWLSLGAKDWSWPEVFPYFRRIETWHGKPSAWRGTNGPIHAVTGKDPCPFYDAFLEAGRQAGFASSNDINGAQPEGFAEAQMNVEDGTRASTAHGYMRHVANHAYLTIASRALVNRIVVEKGRATAVAYTQRGENHMVRATGEIILSAGAFNSPQVMLLSGLGPEAELKRHGIATVANLPEVGENLVDHPLVYYKHESKVPVSPIKYVQGVRKLVVGLEWLLSKSGMGTTNFLETLAMLKSDPSEPFPDIEYQYYPVLFDHDGGYVTGQHGWTNCVGPVRVESKGWVRLRSDNPTDAPRIFTNILAAQADVRRMRDSIKMNRELVHQKAYRDFLKAELEPGPDIRTDQQIDEFLKANTSGDYHPAGTCRMGSDPTAVVDSELRVNGVEGLRIADASIMPSICNANTNYTSIMIGERCADFVLGRREAAVNPQSSV